MSSMKAQRKAALWVLAACAVIVVVGSSDLSTFLGIIALAVYFVPSIVAHRRKHPNENAITVFNLLLGWTLLGWVVALGWAFTNPAPSEPARR